MVQRLCRTCEYIILIGALLAEHDMSVVNYIYIMVGGLFCTRYISLYTCYIHTSYSQ